MKKFFRGFQLLLGFFVLVMVGARVVVLVRTTVDELVVLVIPSGVVVSSSKPGPSLISSSLIGVVLIPLPFLLSVDLEVVAFVVAVTFLVVAVTFLVVAAPFLVVAAPFLVVAAAFFVVAPAFFVVAAAFLVVACLANLGW